MFKNPIKVLLNGMAFLLFLVLCITVFSTQKKYVSVEKISTLLERKISKEVEDVDHFLEAIDSISYSRFFDFSKEEVYRDFIVTDSDTVRFYTSNEIILSDSLITQLPSELTYRKTENRLVLTRKVHLNDSLSLIHIVSLKNNYAYTNKFLRNEILIDRFIPSTIEIGDVHQQGQTIRIDDVALFNISGVDLIWSKHQTRLLFIVFLLAYGYFFIFLMIIYQELSFFETRQNLRWPLFLLDVVIIVSLVLFFRFPHALFETYIFDGQLFIFPAFFHGLGQALFILFPVAVVAGALYKWDWHIVLRNQSVKIFLSIVGVVFMISLFFFTYMLLKYIVFSSDISIKISDPVQLDIDSVFALLLLNVSLISVVFINVQIVKWIYGAFKETFVKWIIFGAGAAFIMLEMLFVNELYFYLLLQFVLIVVFTNAVGIRYKAYFILLMLLVVSSGNSILIEKLYHRKEVRALELKAIRILNNRDQILEFRFVELGKKIKESEQVKAYTLAFLNGEMSSLDFEGKLLAEYFSSLQSKYNVKLTFCSSETDLIVNFRHRPVNCYSYFKSVLEDFGVPTITDDLFFIEDNDEIRNYLARIKVMDDLYFFIDIYEKSSPFAEGYPELLEVGESKSMIVAHDYALYWKNDLINSFGNYNYPIKLNQARLKNDQSYEHYFYYKKNKALVLTISRSEFTNAIAGTSYLFILAGLVFLVLYLLIYQDFEGVSFSRFRSRIQISIFSILLLVFIVIGYFVFTHLGTQNQKKNVLNLNDLSHSILIELEHKLSNLEVVNMESRDFIHEQLVKFSQVFFCDINIYDKNGFLIASSRPQIFEQNILSHRIKNASFSKLKSEELNILILEERIGEYAYLSSYFPLRNYANEIIAYVNLPYFSKQKQLSNEISSFLTTFINIYVILTVMALFLIWVISNYVTKPMDKIKQSLRQTRLSEKNLKIDIKRNDEIGELVYEYNSMIDELEKSAALLAIGERESAWREMAKQVAHEIKNPLTPMKLNVQHLKRVLHIDNEDSQKILDRFTQNMVEQIESLAEIATAFSDFAKMPKGSLKPVEMGEVIHRAVALFENVENVTVQVLMEENGLIFADEKQIQRVFINLLKNSVQALAENEKGKIRVEVSKTDNRMHVWVKDNGSGIDREQVDKIFLPNFTTKTSGAGLGLAMVKSIVESINGSIELVQTSADGTTFKLEFPVYKKSNDE